MQYYSYVINKHYIENNCKVEKVIYCLDNYYFVSTEDVDNISDIIEYCEIVYKRESDFINNIVKE